MVMITVSSSCNVVAFLDFTKAYDTVIRPFFYEVMEARGVGDGLIRWVMILLSDTCTAARVNGHLSKSARYEAGLRQGCPLPGTNALPLHRRGAGILAQRVPGNRDRGNTGKTDPLPPMIC